MSNLTTAQFLAKYADSGTGEFASNTSQAIKSVNLRNMSTDVADSFVNKTDGAALFSAIRRSTAIPASTMLTGNTAPIEVIPALGAGYYIIPISFFVFLDYGSAAFATNTTFRFEINGVAVSATNTTILPGTADRTTSVALVTVDTTTSLLNQPCVLEVQTGNPTGGTGSVIFVTAVYSIGTSQIDPV